MSPAGGSRPGAGRKKLGEKTVMKSVKLKAEQWAKAQLIGDGNAAAGIRKALDKPDESEEMRQQALATELWNMPMKEVFERIAAAGCDITRPAVACAELREMASLLEDIATQAAEFEI